MTTYYSDKIRDMGGDVVFKKSLRLDTKAIFEFANENWVTTTSNVISWIIGIGSVAMVVL